ncbi:hypothetical protein Tco_0877469 [Tanacetum coccineum]|uniref:Uncharacterized protein n=1 Tax=Tanacetum coccineum TaxID=301880 RepID=A0ABQ5BYD7_9ASTR
MACALLHTDSKIEALVQRLINEDKGHQDVLLNLAFQFEDSCAVRDDLRKAYEKCNDISQKSCALICTLLKESSKKDRKLHLSMCSLIVNEKNFELTKCRIVQERIESGGGYCFLSEARCVGLGGLEFSEFVHDPQHVCSQYQLPLSAILRSHSRQLRKNLAIRRSGYIVIVSLGGLEFSEFVHDPQHVCSQYQYQLPLSAILRSHSRQLRENLAIRRLGALCPRSDVSDVGLPSEKVMASGKNGDDGDLLLFRDGPDACDISTGTLRYLDCLRGWRVKSSRNRVSRGGFLFRGVVRAGVSDIQKRTKTNAKWKKPSTGIERVQEIKSEGIRGSNLMAQRDGFGIKGSDEGFRTLLQALESSSRCYK